MLDVRSHPTTRVVIDTNVFISGLNYGGRPRQVLDLLWRGEIQVYVSSFILGELSRVLQDRFRWGPQQTTSLIQEIRSKTVELDPKPSVSIIQAKDDDNRILECAIAGQVGYIITGDTRHILPLGEVAGIRIVTPTQFLQALGVL